MKLGTSIQVIVVMAREREDVACNEQRSTHEVKKLGGKTKMKAQRETEN